MVRATRSAPSTPPTRTMPSRGTKTPEPLGDSTKDDTEVQDAGRRRSMRGAAQQALENFRAPALLKQEQARQRKEEKEARAANKAAKAANKGSPTKKNTKPKSLMPAKALNSDAEESESEESEDSEDSISEDDPDDDEGRLELLQGLWEIPYICHFLWMYQTILAVKPVSPEELEKAFLSLDGSSPILSEIHSKLLLSSKREREVFRTEPEREGYPTLVWQSLVRRKLSDWVEIQRRVEELEEQVENEEDTDEEEGEENTEKEEKVDYEALLEEAERELHELPELFFLRGVNPLQGEESEEEEEEEEGNHDSPAPVADAEATTEVKTEETNGFSSDVKAEDREAQAVPKEEVNGVADAPASEEVKSEEKEAHDPPKKKPKKEKPFVEDTPSVLAAKKALVALNLPRDMEDAALKVAGLYEKMHLAKKVRVLKCLCDWRASDDEFKEELKSIEIEDQRVKPIGKDGSRCEYYHFGFKDNRIYKLTPSTKKQPEQWTLEFKGGQDLGEIKAFTKELKNKKNPRDRALHETFTMLMEELEEEAERMRQEEERKEKERQRQEYLDSLPRRRSSRVEYKAVLNAEQRKAEEEKTRAKAEKEAMIRLQKLQRMAIVEIKKAKGDIEADAAVHEVIEEEDYKEEKVVLNKKKQKALEKRRQTELLKKMEEEEAERIAEKERERRARLREERALKRKVGEEEFQMMVERGEIIPFEVEMAKASKTDENEVVDVEGDGSKPAVGGSSKKRKAATAPAAPPQRDLSDYKKENWVQCERCQKWRRVVDWCLIPDDMQWYCEKNYWDQFNSCEAMEETEPVPVVQAPPPKKQKTTPKKPKSPAPKKPQAAAKLITDRYVMCENCEEWIIVPPNHNIDENADWVCSMNTWDPNLRCKTKDLPAPIPMVEPMDSSSEESAPEEGHTAPITPVTPGAARPDLLSGNWVQCEECDKWREVPEGVLIPPTVSWECSANDWGDGFNTCSAPQAPFRSAV